jgi:hypothetical protein
MTAASLLVPLPTLLRTPAEPEMATQAALEPTLAACSPADFAAAQVTGLLAAYEQRYEMAAWMTEAWLPCEMGGRFNMPLTNPDTGRHSRTFNHAGAYAGIVQIKGKRWLLEHRTTRQEIEAAASPYWQSLTFDGRTAGCLLAHDQAGEPLEGVAYDVVRRPEIRPRIVPKGSTRRSIKENLGTLTEIEQGSYYGCPLPSPVSELIAAEGRESLALYALRLAADARSRPGWYFQRRLFPRNDEQLQRQARDLWQTAGAIRLARRDAQHYRNPAACWNYHRPCEFLALCSGSHTAEATGADESSPSSLEAVEAETRQSLTHSRARLFQLCRRKHFYRYELGLRGDAAPTAAGQFGRLMHEALAGWWRAKFNTAHERPQPGT